MLQVFLANYFHILYAIMIKPDMIMLYTWRQDVQETFLVQIDPSFTELCSLNKQP